MSITPSALAIEQSVAFNILRMCRGGCIPANAILGAAIAAHQMARRDDPVIAAHVLRAVIFASTRTREQRQRQVDYLTELPMEAWEGMINCGPAEAREGTLAMCAWWMTRMEADT